MNLLLFERRDEVARVPWCDARAAHVRDVLRRKVGDRVYVGVVNGPRGLGTIRGMGPEGLELEVAWEEAVVPPFPLLLLVGLPRPQTAKKLLQECTSLGASGLWFFRPGKGEASYAEASLWGSGEWERCVRLGAEQAFVTSVPEVRQFGSLAEALGALGEARVPPALPEAVAPWRIPGMRGLTGGSGGRQVRVALDVYEGAGPLSAVEVEGAGFMVAALGSERGWNAAEREVLRAQGFCLAHLGPRVLRTETAAVAAGAILLSKAGWL